MMYAHNAYGLSIHSAFPLPELMAIEKCLDENADIVRASEADVVIRLGKVNSLSLEADQANGAGRHIHPTSEGVYLAWDDVGKFLVRDGREIVVDPLPGVEERVVRLFILGTTLAMLLHQRGDVVVLHASVAAISGQGAAFVGPKHAGKSTMVAALHAEGHTLVADDILVVDMSQDRPMALPGFPHLKLWPDSAASLGQIPDTLPRLRPELEKRGQRINSGFSSTPIPLQCIYVLSQGPEPEIEPLSPQQALIELMPHWYGARFGTELLQTLGLSTHLRQCASLANRVSVCHLRRPRALSTLPDVTRLVEAHADKLHRISESANQRSMASLSPIGDHTP